MAQIRLKWIKVDRMDQIGPMWTEQKIRPKWTEQDQCGPNRDNVD